MIQSTSFQRLAIIEAYTRRKPGVVNGKVGEPVIQVPHLFCMPLDPVQPELAVRFGLEAPYTGLQTFTTGEALDIVSGDYLTVTNDGPTRTYTVRAAGLWKWRHNSTEEFTAMILESVKGSNGL